MRACTLNAPCATQATRALDQLPWLVGRFSCAAEWAYFDPAAEQHSVPRDELLVPEADDERVEERAPRVVLLPLSRKRSGARTVKRSLVWKAWSSTMTRMDAVVVMMLASTNEMTTWVLGQCARIHVLRRRYPDAGDVGICAAIAVPVAGGDAIEHNPWRWHGRQVISRELRLGEGTVCLRKRVLGRNIRTRRGVALLLHRADGDEVWTKETRIRNKLDIEIDGSESLIRVCAWALC